MTTIVATNEALFADTQGTAAGARVTGFRKVWRLSNLAEPGLFESKDVLIAFAGSASLAQHIVREFAKGNIELSGPRCDGYCDCAVLTPDRRLYRVTYDGDDLRNPRKTLMPAGNALFIGSGSDYAQAAYMITSDPIHSIIHAAAICVHTNDKVQSVCFDDPPLVCEGSTEVSVSIYANNKDQGMLVRRWEREKNTKVPDKVEETPESAK